jgi:hypothetical protein
VTAGQSGGDDEADAELIADKICRFGFGVLRYAPRSAMSDEPVRDG